MLNILGQYRRETEESEQEYIGDKEKADEFDLTSFKIVYVAPMKALVQEVVKNFSDRLSPYGVTVAELSGDSSLTRQQISETQLIVTTPEKFDITLRQGEGRAFTQLVKVSSNVPVLVVIFVSAFLIALDLLQLIQSW